MEGEEEEEEEDYGLVGKKGQVSCVEYLHYCWCRHDRMPMVVMIRNVFCWVCAERVSEQGWVRCLLRVALKVVLDA